MRLIKVLAFGVFNILAITSLRADTVTFGSAVAGPGTFEGNTFNGTNQITVTAGTYHAGLGDSLWESIYADTMNADGTSKIDNGTIIEEYDGFYLPGVPDAGSLGILVDDSALGLLNGFLIFNNIASPQGTNCAASLPNCVTPLYLDITPYLTQGWNELEVFVSQDGGAQMAWDVFGTATYGALEGLSAATPEPATIINLAAFSVLLGVRVVVDRRRKATSLSAPK
jgi:hypothetical protein